MTPDMLDEAVIYLMILAGFLAALGIGGVIADLVFPHIPFIQRYLESLPDWEEDEEMERVRRRRAAHRSRRRSVR